MKKLANFLKTKRLILRRFRQNDLDAFARMHADPEVMHDLGGPISLEESQNKLSRYMSMVDEFGYSRYCVEDNGGRFVGYVGICPGDDGQSVGKHNEIGWRLNKSAWGKGYATEAATACISEFFSTYPDAELVSYTSAENKRSQKVMARLNMDRQRSRDFQWINSDGTSLRLLVWASRHAV